MDEDDAGQSDGGSDSGYDTASYGDDDAVGTATIPEVTVYGDPDAPAATDEEQGGNAYWAGYAAGQAMPPDDGHGYPRSMGQCPPEWGAHSGMWEQGFQDGYQAAHGDMGPSIRPSTPEEIEQQQEEHQREVDRRSRRAMLGEDPDKPEGEPENPFQNEEPAEWPEMPEIVE